jgi:hypothetical protein
MSTRTIVVSVGTPFATGEECPVCLFDSVHAVLVMVQSQNPRFLYACGRRCGWDPPARLQD